MKTIRIDDNSHGILEAVKEKMKKDGIESPSLSDAIRKLAEWAGFQVK